MKSDKDLLNELLAPMERDVIMYALCAGRKGRAGRKPKAYRNRFLASMGQLDWDIARALVKRELMSRENVDWLPYDIFKVTEAGAAAAGMDLPK